MIKGFSQYLVEEQKTIYFTFGRMNPPTIGHGKLMDKLSSSAGRNPYRIYLSQSQDSKDNPLAYSEKIKYARKMFPKHSRFIIMNNKIKTIFEVCVSLYNEGFRSIALVVGSDRVSEFKSLISKYNGQSARHGFYNFKNIDIVSAGQRDPDAKGAEGASGTKQRGYAKNNDFSNFSLGLPKSVNDKDAKSLFNAVRLGMGLKEQKEFRNHLQLNSISDIREKFVEGKIFNIGEKVVIKGSEEVAVVTHKGSNYVILEKFDNTIVRKWIDAVEPLEEAYDVGTPEYVLHYAKGTPGQFPVDFPVKGQKNTAEVGEKTTSPQDPDIKDRKGTQPKAYHGKDAKGREMSKSTKAARDRHFKKGAKMDDNNPSAYKPAPGDKGAKTKPSKHTIKFKQMFGDNTDPLKVAQARVDREKKSDALKFDRRLDRARLARARMKNAKTKGK
tara:strand:- start:2287 stop:3612 length:1326 start_codon:yes stop_codon:yes gene_type:complete